MLGIRVLLLYKSRNDFLIYENYFSANFVNASVFISVHIMVLDYFFIYVFQKGGKNAFIKIPDEILRS